MRLRWGLTEQLILKIKKEKNLFAKEDAKKLKKNIQIKDNKR